MSSIDMDNLLRGLHDSDETERLYAVQDLAETENPDVALHLLDRLVIEESRAIRDAIVFGLKTISCSRVYDALFGLFCSPDAYLRNAAVVILGSQGDDAVGFLASNLDHSNREVRKLTLDALFQIGSPDAVLAVRACLYDRAPNVQITAVEYLGRLQDEASMDEMLEIFQKSPEPMLRTSILESLSLMGAGTPIRKALNILAPHGDFSGMDPIYIPQAINLAAKAGNPEDLSAVIDSVEEMSVYADDIMRALEQAKRRHPDLLLNDGLFKSVLDIAGDSLVREDVRYAAVNSILVRGCAFSDNSPIYFLALRLASDESMVYAGVKLLACCCGAKGVKKTREIMEDTKDEELRTLCLELVEA
jgi:HEAT repeat protein